jgi:putative ABC transport system ATP-binding protein
MSNSTARFMRYAPTGRRSHFRREPCGSPQRSEGRENNRACVPNELQTIHNSSRPAGGLLSRLAALRTLLPMSSNPQSERAPSPAAAPIVETRDLVKIYETDEHRVTALGGVTLSVAAGRFTAIMGASGSGKSTLLHLIGGLTRPTSGRVLVEGHNLGAMSDRARTIFRRRRLGIIFQEYNLLPTLTAAENVALPWLVDGKGLPDVSQRVRELLGAVHLEHRTGHRPDALSGGEQQRVAIARALLNDPAIILADEPTGNLDSRQSLEIWRLMRRIVDQQGKTILMVTHEAHGAAHADDVIILKDGAVVGVLEPKGSADAALVATGYQKLAV